MTADEMKENIKGQIALKLLQYEQELDGGKLSSTVMHDKCCGKIEALLDLLENLKK